MTHSRIIDSIGIVRDVTGEDPSTVGASIFVHRPLTEKETSELNERIEPQIIDHDAGFDDEPKTRIDL